MRLEMIPMTEALWEKLQKRTTLQFFQNQGPDFNCGQYMLRCMGLKGICSIYLTDVELDSFLANIEETRANRSLP